MKGTFELAFGILLAMISVQNYLDKNYGDCYLPMKAYFVILPAMLSSLNAATVFTMNSLCEKFWSTIRIIISIFVVLHIMLGLPLMILISIKTPDCVPLSYLLTSWLLIGMFNLLFYLIIGIVVLVLFKAYMKHRRTIIAKEDVDKMYEKIYSINIEKYLKDTADVIDSFSPTKKELEIIKDKYSLIVKGIQKDVNENEKEECVICMGPYEIGESVTLHPGCKHIFHYDCLICWFEKQTKCPTCRRLTRSSMFRTFKLYDNNIPENQAKFLLGQ